VAVMSLTRVALMRRQCLGTSPTGGCTWGENMTHVGTAVQLTCLLGSAVQQIICQWLNSHDDHHYAWHPVHSDAKALCEASRLQTALSGTGTSGLV
jgi:hypothetical protein